MKLGYYETAKDIFKELEILTSVYGQYIIDTSIIPKNIQKTLTLKTTHIIPDKKCNTMTKMFKAFAKQH